MDDEKTAFVNQEPQYSQQQYNQYYAPQPYPYNQQQNVQYTQPPYTDPNYQYVQPVSDPYTQQVNPYFQPNGQQYGQQMNPYAQPDAQQYGQQMNPYAQPDSQQYGQQMNPYAQPINPYAQYGSQQNFNTAYDENVNPATPVKEKKPKKASTNTNTNINKKLGRKDIIISTVSSVIGIAVLTVFFLVILPLITGGKLSGRYEYNNEWFIFEDGVYVLGDSDSGYTSIGTYEVSGTHLKIKNAGETDSETELTYNSKKNQIDYDGDIFKCTAKDDTLGVNVDADYIDNIEETVKTAVEDTLAIEPAYDEAMQQGVYFIYGNDLKNPGSEFEKYLAECLDYDNNELLQYMFEEADTAIDISIDSTGSAAVNVY
jgi:hypothetical protein